MRFTLRTGTGPDALADRAMLAALGLPAGGVVAVGETHARVLPGQVPSPLVMVVAAPVLANAGLTDGVSADVRRVSLPPAASIVVPSLDGPSPSLPSSLIGHPVTAGDTLHLDGTDHVVRAVVPGPAAIIGRATLVTDVLPAPEDDRPLAPDGSAAASTPTTTRGPAHGGPSMATALLGGLDQEVETLTGWFRLLAGSTNLPAAWGLPEVAGVVVEAPPGCGGPEVVAEAARRAGAHLHHVRLDLVFKPTRLLDLLERAVREAPRPGVIHVDRLEAVAGEEGLSTFRTQVGAVMRWFLDAVARQPGLAVALGVTSTGAIDPTITGSPLVPRTLRIPHPTRPAARRSSRRPPPGYPTRTSTSPDSGPVRPGSPAPTSSPPSCTPRPGSPTAAPSTPTRSLPPSPRHPRPSAARASGRSHRSGSKRWPASPTSSSDSPRP